MPETIDWKQEIIAIAGTSGGQWGDNLSLRDDQLSDAIDGLIHARAASRYTPLSITLALIAGRRR